MISWSRFSQPGPIKTSQA